MTNNESSPAAARDAAPCEAAIMVNREGFEKRTMVDYGVRYWSIPCAPYPIPFMEMGRIPPEGVIHHLMAFERSADRGDSGMPIFREIESRARSRKPHVVIDAEMQQKIDMAVSREREKNARHVDDLEKLLAVALDPHPAASFAARSASDCAVKIRKGLHCEAESQLALALEALSGMLPLAQKLFNNTVAAAMERGTPLQPAGVTFDDLKFVQKSRAILAATAKSSQGTPDGVTPQATTKGLE